MATENQPKSKKKKLLLSAVLMALVVSGVLVFIVLSSSANHIPTVPSGAASSQVTPYYLPLPSGGDSKILVTTVTSAYGTYPFASASPLGSPNGPVPTPVIERGDSCFIVNVTIRNDYTDQNLPPNQPTMILPNGETYTTNYSHVYVYLTAQIYDKHGNVIAATDVTPPYGFTNGGANTFLNSGENTTLTIYLATSRQDIDHFNIAATYIGASMLP